jgi:Holliday junction resolvase RusA-like endonuclease
MITFTIPGSPVGKGRPRFAKRGNFVQTYTPEKTASYESLVKLAADVAMAGAVPMDCAIICEIYIEITPPASWSKKRVQQALDGVVMPTVKPDLDNVGKLVLDACNGIVWVDDKQVVKLLVTKCYGMHNLVMVAAGAA